MSSGYGVAASVEPNFAPLRPIEEAKDKSVKSNLALEKFLKDKVGKLYDRYKETWDAKALDAEANELFYRGYQRLRKSTYANCWRPLSPKPVHYTINSFRFWSDLITSKWVGSSTDYEIDVASDTDEAVAGGRVAEHIADHYGGKFYTQIHKIIESKRAQFEGNIARYVYYNPNLPVKARIPVTEYESVQLAPSAAFCAECGYGGPADEFSLGQSAEVAPPEMGGPQEPGYPMANEAGIIGSGGGVPPSDAEGLIDPSSQSGIGVRPDDIGARAPFAASDQQIPAAYGEGQDGEVALFDTSGAIPRGVGGSDISCPSCGSSIVQITPVEPAQIPQTHYEERQVGDLDFQSVSLYNLRYDVTCGLEESNYLIWDIWLDRETADSLYPNLKKSNDGEPDIQSMAREQLERHSVSSGSRDTSREDRVKLRRVWLKPAMYGTYRNDVDTETLAGVLPRNTYLTENFAPGMYLAIIGATIVDMRPECKDDHWCGTGYFLLPTSGLHDGISDMREPQRQMNSGKSLLNLWMRHQASPSTLINPLLVDPAEYSGEPHKNVPIKYENLGLIDGMTIKDGVFPIPGTPFPGGVMAYNDVLKSDLQLAAHATDFSGGLPGVGNKTATGAEITRDLAQSIHTTQLAQRAYLDAKTANLILKLFRKYCWDERWVQLKGKYGDLDGQYFSAADIDFDFDVQPVLDSWIPRTKQEKQQNLETALNVLGLAGGMLMAPPSLIAEVADTYGVDFGDEKFSQGVRMARERVNQMTKAAPSLAPLLQMLPPTEMVADPMSGMMAEVPVDPMAEAGQLLIQMLKPQVNPRELGMEEGVQFLRGWYLTDEGREADPILIAGVNALVDLMIELVGQAGMVQAAIGAQVQMAGMPPMPEQDADGKSTEKDKKDSRKKSAKANMKGTEPGALAPSAPPQ